MEDWGRFKSFPDYVTWVGKDGNHGFLSKVTDAKFLGLGNFFTSFIPKAPADRKTPPTECMLGILSLKGITLNAASLYCAVEKFPRQGDIFELPTSVKGRFAAAPARGMFLSQTCSLERDDFVALLPVYSVTSFEGSLKQLCPSKEGKPSFLDQLRRNEPFRFIFLPATDHGLDEPHVVDLAQSVAISSTDVKSCSTPVLSLTYPGVAYLSNRYAAYLFRDVRDCDDKRVVR